MLRTSAKRIAALVVSRYGGDRGRVRQTLRAVLDQRGTLSDLLAALTEDGLLTRSQAEEVRVVLERERNRTPMPAALANAAPVLPVPRTLGGCRLLRCLGEGGMGAVYLAYHEVEKCQVAVKVLAAELADNPVCRACFYRESKTSVLLDHPNLVRGLGAGRDEAGGVHYLVREFVDGPSSHALLDRAGRLPVGAAVRIALDVARALDYLHGRQFVHRDVKPDNILLSRGGAKLTDLGLVQRIGTPPPESAIQGFGTSYYMPCEQALNVESLDGRADIFALGATLYHLLTGQVPFPGENHHEIIACKQRGAFRPARDLNPEVPAELDAILARMLARRAEDRYPSAVEVIADLEASGLAAPLPISVGLDPNAPAADTGQPTVFDMRSAKETSVWYLRYRDTGGQRHWARASTDELLRRLRTGRMPLTARAAAEPRGRYQPLTAYPLFRDVRPAPAEIHPDLAVTRLRPPENVVGRRRVVPAVVAAVLALLGLLCWRLMMSS